MLDMLSLFSLQGRIAVIADGSRGIGRMIGDNGSVAMRACRACAILASIAGATALRS